MPFQGDLKLQRDIDLKFLLKSNKKYITDMTDSFVSYVFLSRQNIKLDKILKMPISGVRKWSN